MPRMPENGARIVLRAGTAQGPAQHQRDHSDQENDADPHADAGTMPLRRLRHYRRLLLHRRRILLYERVGRAARGVAAGAASTFRVLTDARFGLRETGRVGEADLRIERLGLLDLGEGVGITAFAIEHLAVQVVRARIVRMRLQYFAQTGIGLLPVALRHGGFDLLDRRHSERRGRHEQQ